MRSSDLDGVRRELGEWSEPVIVDRVREFYAVCLAGNVYYARALARQHCRLWHDLLSECGGHTLILRRELIALSRLAGLQAETVDRIDQIVLDELADVVMARFHRSPATACDYNRSLIRVASNLAEARLFAA